MADLRDSRRFLPLSALPVLTKDTTILAAFQRLSFQSVGGLVVAYSSDTYSFVIAQLFADAARKQAKQTNWEEVSGESIESLIKTDPSLAIQIKTINVASSATEQQKEAAVIFRVTEKDIAVGWFITSESILGRIYTNPPAFYCEKDPPHANSDPDHGKCHFCRHKLK
jgi:hypothetical protein